MIELDSEIKGSWFIKHIGVSKLARILPQGRHHRGAGGRESDENEEAVSDG